MTDQAQAPEVQGFDIDSLENLQEITHKCAFITDAEGNPLSGVIMVGKNSVEYQQVSARNKISNIMRAGARKKNVDTATEEGAQIIAKTVDSNDRATALAVCIGFFGFNKAGQPVEFSQELLNRMFDKCPQWQQKVLADLEVEGNFMPA